MLSRPFVKISSEREIRNRRRHHLIQDFPTLIEGKQITNLITTVIIVNSSPSSAVHAI